MLTVLFISVIWRGPLYLQISMLVGLRCLLVKTMFFLFCGTDDHGSTSLLSAQKEGVPLEDFIGRIHDKQEAVLKRYYIGLDVYSGTSRADLIEDHKRYCQEFLCKLFDNGMLEQRTSKQWFDPELKVFLPDRYVTGTCPRCGADGAYSEECGHCHQSFLAEELLSPKSSLGEGVPELRETEHWYLNMWKVIEPLREWILGKQKTWHKNILKEVLGNVSPGLIFSKAFEEKYKKLKKTLPKHTSRYISGKRILLACSSMADLIETQKIFNKEDIENTFNDSWAYRPISRDVSWGIPIPHKKAPDLKGKTLYVWPESLIAPISFSRLALLQQGKKVESYSDFWRDPESRAYQFLGQDNVFFYVLVQGAMWLGTQKDPLRLPVSGELQMTEIFSNCHLQLEGDKMSKSRGNFYSGDDLLDKKGYHPDQIRYFLSLLSLSEKNSTFDFETLNRRNQFLAGPMNAALEKPISACHSKFNGIIPQGKLIGKVPNETKKVIANYCKFMEKAQYGKLLFLIENYARLINGLFAKYKPHDDRLDEEERKDALYSSFYVLKNVLIMLHPFVPSTMERLRQTLNIPESVYSVDELGRPFPKGHKIGVQTTYFPSA